MSLVSRSRHATHKKLALICLIFLTQLTPLTASLEPASDTELIIQWQQPTQTRFSRGLTHLNQHTLPEALSQRGIKSRSAITTQKHPSNHTIKAANSGPTQPTTTYAEWEVITFDTPQDNLDQLVDALSSDPRIAHVQRNYLYAIPTSQTDINTFTSAFNISAFAPDDTLFSQQTHHLHTNTQKAWQLTQGSDTTIVAVIDTGIDLNHPDLVDNAWINPNEIAGNNIDDDGNGFVDDIIGWDFVFNNNTPEDVDGHGSHVIGIAMADTNNSLGVAGGGFGSKVMILKAAHTGSFSSAHIASSLYYAIKNGAHIVNMSFGGVTVNGDSTMENAVASANANGLLLIAAAGNSKEDIASANLTRTVKGTIIPATYPGVLTVSAANVSGIFDTTYSNFGAKVDLIAQGTNVLSFGLVNENPSSPYSLNTGTSMAAPYIAGIASLLKAAKPSITSTNMYTALTQTATDLGNAGVDPQNGFGMPNILAALQFLDEDPPILTHSPQSIVDIGDELTISLTATDDLISHQFPTVTLNYQYFVADTPSGDSITVTMNKNNTVYSYTLPEQTASHDIRYYFNGGDSISTHNTRLPATNGQTFTQQVRDITGPVLTFLQANTTDTIIKNQDYFTNTQEIDVQIAENTFISTASIRVTVNNTTLTIADDALSLLDNTLTIALAGLNLDTENLSLSLSVKDIFDNETTGSLGLNASNSSSFSVLGADGVIGLFNAPNPFSPNSEETTIGFQLSQSATVECHIYTLNLTRLKTVEESYSAGYHTIKWDGKDDSGDIVPNGVYPVLFKATGETGSYKEHFKIVVFK